MKKLPAILLGLILASPAAACAQSFSQLSQTKGTDVGAVPEPAPEAVESPADPDNVDFLVRPDAEHEPGAQLFPPSRTAAKSVARTQNEEIPYLALARAEAAANGIDLALVLAVIQKESSFDPKARSSVGAVGLMQVMPATAKHMGLKNGAQLKDPAVNIKYGVKYLKYLWDQFADTAAADISAADIGKTASQMAIAAYNAGQGNVRKYNGIPPFKETRAYVKKVTEYFTYFSDMLETSRSAGK